MFQRKKRKGKNETGKSFIYLFDSQVQYATHFIFRLSVFLSLIPYTFLSLLNKSTYCSFFLLFFLSNIYFNVMKVERFQTRKRLNLECSYVHKLVAFLCSHLTLSLVHLVDCPKTLSHDTTRVWTDGSRYVCMFYVWKENTVKFEKIGSKSIFIILRFLKWQILNPCVRYLPLLNAKCPHHSHFLLFPSFLEFLHYNLSGNIIEE